MTQGNKEFSVGQLARQSGVSVRTLHHYDDIGLLKPAHLGANGYRYYGQAELLRLQEILFYRDVGLALSDVQQILEGPLDTVSRLVRHREHLQEQHRKTADLIETLDVTIAHLQGKKDIDIAALYKPFGQKKQAEYEAWLVAKYGGDMAMQVQTSRAAIAKMPKKQKGAMQELQSIEAELVAAFESGLCPHSEGLHQSLERHRLWVTKMWGRDCDPDGFAGLADLYAAHPDFVARYETLSAKFSDWLPKAMKAQSDRLRSTS